MKSKIVISLLIICSFNLSNHIISQMSYGGKPITLKESSHNSLRMSKQDFEINTIYVPDLNKNQIQQELNNMKRSCEDCNSRSFYGKEVELNINFFEQATSYQTEDSMKVWILQLSSNEAEGFQLIFNKFHLIKGSQMFVYNEDKTMILGAFTSENNRDCNTFITQNINGKSIYIEYSEPLENEGSEIMLEKVVYIFSKCFVNKGPFVGEGEGAAPCQINTSCSLGNGYDIEIKSTAIILSKNNNNYWGTCSGVLINDGTNYLGRLHPFFLTANHCYEDIDEKTGKTTFYDPKDWLFLFRHEATTCNSNGSDVPNNTTKSALGARILLRDEHSAGADYMLLELNNNISDISKYDVVFAGYDYFDASVPLGFNLQPIISVHHPQGDVKKISRSKLPAQHTGWNKDGDDHWKVTFTTGFKSEPGSSGAPLFDSEHRIVGICHGSKDGITCNDPYDTWQSLYGKLSRAYDLPKYLLGSISDSFIFSTEPVNSDLDPKSFKLQEYIITNRIVNEPIKIETQITDLSSSSVGKKVQWELKINKYPGDFKPDYLCSDNDFVYCETGFSQVFKYNAYENHATYRFKDVILDIKGYYYISLKISTELNNYEDIFEKVLYLYIDDRKNPCIDVDLNVYNPKQKYALGESVWIKEIINIKDDITHSSDICHDGIPYGYPGLYFHAPNYVGVGKLSWIINGTTLETKEYNTVVKYSDIVPGVYYEPMDYQEFSLDNPGLNTIMLKVFGGNYNSWALTNGRNNILPDTIWHSFQFEVDPYSPSNKSLNFIVVDCDGSAIITNINDPLLSSKESVQKEIGKGTIEIQNVKFDDNKNYEVEAYKSIILGPCTEIKEGTSFHAKINPASCSNFNLLNNSARFISDREFEEVGITTGNSKIINISNEKINIYPNITSGIINIIIPDNTIINNVKVYDISGKLLYNNDQFRNNPVLNLSHFKKGIYILTIFSSLSETSHKIIIKR